MKTQTKENLNTTLKEQIMEKETLIEPTKDQREKVISALPGFIYVGRVKKFRDSGTQYFLEKVRCNACGNDSYFYFAHIINKKVSGCNHCKELKARKEVEERLKNTSMVLVSLAGDKAVLKCNKCGYEKKDTKTHILKSTSYGYCPGCFEQDILQHIQEKISKDFKLLEIFQKPRPSNNKKFDKYLKLKCLKCGEVIERKYEELDRVSEYHCVCWRKTPDVSKAELEELYINKDLTTYQIADMLGVDQTTVSNWIILYGIHKSLQKEIYSKEKIEELLTSGLTPLDIATKFGMTYERFKSHCYNVGVRLPFAMSGAEQELTNFLEDFRVNTCKVIAPLELDFYSEKYKLGVEFNGSYWHSEIFKKENTHVNKTKLCEDKGITLYHIFEYDWENPIKKSIILSQLNNLLGRNSRKIFARNCGIKLVQNKDRDQFLNENHIQGETSSSVNLGLYFQDTLVSLMTFSKPRLTDKVEWELVRFCNLKNTTVIGAASKLFKYFLSTYNPKSIISYSDRARTKGNLYPMLGFKFSHCSEPSYVWWKSNNNYLSRYKCQKKKLIEEGFDPNKTEVQIMRERGYVRIWDCGTKAWIWKA